MRTTPRHINNHIVCVVAAVKMTLTKEHHRQFGTFNCPEGNRTPAHHHEMSKCSFGHATDSDEATWKILRVISGQVSTREAKLIFTGEIETTTRTTETLRTLCDVLCGIFDCLKKFQVVWTVLVYRVCHNYMG